MKIVETTSIEISFFEKGVAAVAPYLGIRSLPAIALTISAAEKAGKDQVRALIDGKEYTKRELRGMFPNLYGRIELERS